MKSTVLEDNKQKIFASEDYNFVFDKTSGMFARWGKTKEEDPEYTPHGAEILDLEISSGKCMGKCAECYKCNGDVQEQVNMTMDEFKNVFHKVANTKFRQDGDKIIVKNFSPLTQIAFGICDIGSNPDFFNMMEYSRKFGVIPNYTCHALDMNEEYAKKTAELCGAVAISVYNKEKSYNAVKMLADAGMKQINFHVVTHDKSFEKIKSIMDDIVTDERLIGNVKALVMLKYKPKGNNTDKFHQITLEQMRELIAYSEEKGVGIGFDSCTAHFYLRAIEGDKDFDKKSMYVEPCESSCFSSYINCKGEFYPCSFTEGEINWRDGLSVLESDNFVDDIWNNEKTLKFRNRLLKNCRKCPVFNLDGE